MRVYGTHQQATPHQAALHEAIPTPSHSNAEFERLRATDVVQQAYERLQHTPFPTLRHVCCTYSAGVLTLDGQLPSFYLKQIAQECLRDLPHVRQVENHLEVHS